jgi:hypothetical protein
MSLQVQNRYFGQVKYAAKHTFYKAQEVVITGWAAFRHGNRVCANAAGNQNNQWTSGKVEM